jgi:hypothetical protein
MNLSCPKKWEPSWDHNFLFNPPFWVVFSSLERTSVDPFSSPMVSPNGLDNAWEGPKKYIGNS